MKKKTFARARRLERYIEWGKKAAGEKSTVVWRGKKMIHLKNDTVAGGPLRSEES